ncbi:hypothetical protein AVL59_07740 [Streptomyces griseochromogenes]|nr:hypothetical protein AVL59_07740 [Streptomyces griseochromogenes]
MPAGKAIASVAMPTAVLMGMGFTSSLALADNGGSATSNSQKAAEYKDCVKALDGSKDASASPSPSASESTGTATPTPTASADGQDAKDTTGSGKASSSDSGSGDTATPKPTPSSGSGSGSGSGSSDSGSGGTATPAPSASQSGGGGLLDTIGDTIGDIGNVLTGGTKDSGTSASPAPSASSSPSPSSSGTPSSSGGSGASDTAKKATDTVKDTVDKATDTVKDTTGTVSKTAGDATQAAKDAAASATPSPSASSTKSADDCQAATDDEGGVDNKVPVADDPWYLNASSLLLKGADYQGIVEVKTADGTKKKVLKYVISGGTDIGDLHQTVNDKQSGKVYHVQASKGSTSTIRNGDTVMYTQSISGNLFGLIPVTFSPDSPPPLNIPLIYFTNVKVVQAAQFGGSLHVPGMHVYTTD